MITVSRSIEVPAGRADATHAWDQFIESVLIGRRRLACDDVACVSAVETGVVTFEPVDDAHTRLTLNVPLSTEESDGAKELLEHKMSHDLVLFWSYLDGDFVTEHGRPSADERRSGVHTVRDHVQNDADTISTRRSFRS
jgi:hypothetical protein